MSTVDPAAYFECCDRLATEGHDLHCSQRRGALIRRVYEVEVLYREGETETDVDSASLESLAYETCDGAASGLVSIKSTETLTPAAIAAKLKAQGSDPSFLLDEDDEMVRCKLCGELAVGETAHLHQGEYIGDECCWDERLRSTE